MRRTARDTLLDAALRLVREQGYAGMTVDGLCARAKVTKGAFFHHFASKEDLGVAVAEHWASVTSEVFAQAPYHAFEDPLERVLGYVDFRTALLRGELAEFTCVVGTMVQEVFQTSPAIRDACASSIFGHARTLESDIQAAMDAHEIDGPWTAASLARHTQAVLQGAFVLAKAHGDASVAVENADHLRRYIELLFTQQETPV